MLHGFTGTALDWQPCIGARPDWLPIDLPGHCRASDPEGRFEEVVRSLLAGLPSSIDELIGYSLGGRIALAMIREAPERFRAATILSAHPGLTDPSAREARRAQDQRWIALLRERGIEAFVAAWELQPLFHDQSRLAPEALERQRTRRLGQRPEGLAKALTCLGLAEMPSTWEAIDHYPGRLRWVVGSRDAKFLEIAQEVVARRPKTQLAILAGVGHNPLLEAPDALRNLLIDTATPESG